MIHASFITDLDRIPIAGDFERAADGLERWREAARKTRDSGIAGFAEGLADDPAGRAILEAVFGNSPYLGRCLLDEIAFAREIFESGPDAAFPALLEGLEADLGHETDGDRLMRELRRGKHRAALLIALADITELWPLEKVTASLSRFADGAVSLAVRHLLRRAAAGNDILPADRDDPENGSGFFVLGVGKLGAHELNYSSDIDLIVLFDDWDVEYVGDKTIQDFFVRLTRNLIRILDERTEDGYVFRTDLRLRPDPGSTPVAMSVLAAELYYESAGQNWERAAMIKARTVAGDREAGDRFLKRLRPFLWRKHLDFAAIDDIHSIKRQINAFRGQHDIKVGGQNLKLCPGGIREIEFFVQTQQLIWGGREPSLRVAATCAALDALVEAGHVAKETRDDLVAAYRFLRRVEHRLQMVDDKQVHSLPEDEAGLRAIAAFLGYDGPKVLGDELLRHLHRVRSLYSELFEEAPSLSGSGNLVFTGAEDDPETLSTLSEMGFRDVANIAAVVRRWHHGRYPATRSVRSRELLTELMPALLTALANTTDPDTAFMKFNDFLSHLPAGVQLFSLFHSNPGLLDLVAEIMGSAPRLADRLSRRPILLDSVLTTGFLERLPSARQLDDELRQALSQANDFEDILDISRRWAKDRRFQIGVHILRNITDAETAAPIFSDIGDILFKALQPEVEREFEKNYGRMPGSGLAVVAMGKLGSREMTVISDIDLIFIYADVDEDTVSDGERPLSPNVYFSRLSQRLINAFTAKTAEAELYEVDMRLRPSGNAGPIASSLEAFRRYQNESAWVWEHMALTRARVVSGPDDLRRDIEATIRDILSARRAPDKLVVEVAEMRERIEETHHTDSIWEIKHLRGGVIDIEFIAQYLQLRHAHAHPEVLSQNTVTALERLATAGVLDKENADSLIEALRMYHRLQGLIRLCLEGAMVEEAASDGLHQALAVAGGAADFAALREKVAATAARVRELFAAIIETPARNVKSPPEELPMEGKEENPSS